MGVKRELLLSGKAQIKCLSKQSGQKYMWTKDDQKKLAN
jgi:hypothetical protein